MPSIRGQHAQALLNRHHNTLGAIPPLRSIPRNRDEVVTVGIIGAGAAGLYAAMILESFKEYGYHYEILEAEPNDGHTGGRLWTHKFSASENDYYDRGAMRFPDIPFMKRVFDLFDLLEISHSDPKQDRLIPYVMSNPNNMLFYNNIRMTVEQYNQTASAVPDPFNMGLKARPETILATALGRFKDELKTNFATGWEKMMNYDEFSTRDYIYFELNTPKHLCYTDKVITNLETMESATNLYDCALSESVMDSLDFDWNDDQKWFCVQGGAEVISQRMATRIRYDSIHRGKRVTTIAPASSPGSIIPPTSMHVTVAGESTPRTYSHVIATMPLSCLALVDTTQCNLSWDVQTAIRVLHYDASVKVAIKFTKRWWEAPPFNNMGGVSSTDRPTRVVIYPSYGMGGTDATIIVSYTWAQDAMRFGALAHGKNSESEKILLEVILKDLADIHGHYLTADSLRDMVVDHEVWSWYNHENSAGAFALFGPGQFSNLYPELTKPPAGLLHFAGEASSVHHAWVLGALNSAYRSIHEILVAEGRDDLVKILQEKWGLVDEVDDPLVKKQVALGQAKSIA
ncbi:uncharacterized protein FIBRA_00853 [Fibroporia radiculosa]|uniref:Amine oxidase domain-containing protein n=1 Tax=Fibroporia radiculosa TaxID=599839 RepID=J4HSA9_9APHY|nr:uncharacterized protein FIBRA_00853 [Fibroporia radiculosa]QXO97781.1 L-amino acid oxidase 1 [synthetic construct]CCL98847.1 predicted protein [Fibroporia radiculosa]